MHVKFSLESEKHEEHASIAHRSQVSKCSSNVLDVTTPVITNHQCQSSLSRNKDDCTTGHLDRSPNWSTDHLIDQNYFVFNFFML